MLIYSAPMYNALYLMLIHNAPIYDASQRRFGHHCDQHIKHQDVGEDREEQADPPERRRM